MKNRILLEVTVIVHYLVVAGLSLAIPLSLIFQPWYIFLTITTIVVRTALDRQICPLSQLECHYQRKLGLPEKDKFIKHHIIFNWNRLLKRLK